MLIFNYAYNMTKLIHIDNKVTNIIIRKLSLIVLKREFIKYFFIKRCFVMECYL